MEIIRNKILFVLLLVICSSKYLTSSSVDSGNPKVLVQLYYESLCPYCQKFVVNQLSQLLDKQDLWKIIDVRMYPFGNAKQNKWGKTIYTNCQHGEDECLGNMIMNCAIDKYDFKTQALPFIVCFEGIETDWQTGGNQCVKGLNMDWETINDCSVSFQGEESMFKVGLMTQFANVNSVPYLVINGDHNTAAINSLVEQICKAYKGPEVIASCLPSFQYQ